MEVNRLILLVFIYGIHGYYDDVFYRTNAPNSDRTGVCADVNKCRYGRCENIGTNDFVCHCIQPGIGGKNCDRLCRTKPCGPCESNPCLGGGNCIPSGTAFTCICPPNRTGQKCETITGAVPITQFPPVTSGVTQAQFCQPNPCLNSGQCISNGLSFYCICKNGFTGQRCEKAGAIPTSPTANACAQQPCQNNGQCIPNGAAFTCNCVNGYSGFVCQNPPTPATQPPASNACLQNPCQNNGQCVPNGASFKCNCINGYSGFVCQNTPQPGTVPVQLTSPAPTTGPCMSGPCKNGGTCSDINNIIFACSCVPGTYGVTCENGSPVVSPCNPNPCKNNGVCTTNGITPVCSCIAGFAGQFCEKQGAPTGPCLSQPCRNGGQCRNTMDTGYICSCAGTFSGRNCESDLRSMNSFCTSDPCQHNGVCISNVPTDFGPVNLCLCPGDYGGEYCQKFGCVNNQPCQNGGRCYTINGMDNCNCSAPFTGDNCESIDACTNRVCNNGGTCIDGQCYCLPGYSGFACEYIVPDFCRKSPCKSGATCVQEYPSPGRCVCPGNVFGALCDNNPCLPNPCKNRGKCMVNGFGTYRCVCGRIYKGANCQITECFPSNSVVTLADGSEKPMEQLEINDELLSSNGESTTLIGWLHRQPNKLIENEYIKLFVELNDNRTSTITATSHHLIQTPNGFEYMKNLEINDYVIDEKGENVRIISKEISQYEIGAMAPLTSSGTLVVNNICTSSYAIVKSHQLAHWTLWPIRVIHQFLPSFLEASNTSRIDNYTNYLLRTMDGIGKYFPSLVDSILY
ncbi:hypothetical protein SNEBB_005784 [Seison nebaliae]|nr:hypothetical protein SNEBB_005784 [Seison nebaliae]